MLSRSFLQLPSCRLIRACTRSLLAPYPPLPSVSSRQPIEGSEMTMHSLSRKSVLVAFKESEIYPTPLETTFAFSFFNQAQPFLKSARTWYLQLKSLAM